MPSNEYMKPWMCTSHRGMLSTAIHIAVWLHMACQPSNDLCSHNLALSCQHCRAHYSQGQVYALTNNWQAAADSYQAAAAAAHVNLSKDPAAYGQTLYCLAIAQQRLQQQEAALTTLEEASQYWPQPYTLALCKAHCLEALGRVEECVGVVDAALAGQAGSMEVQSGAVRQALVDLKQKLVPAAGQS
jgi:tetratricopeptide (TPR) repeat protein